LIFQFAKEMARNISNQSDEYKRIKIMILKYTECF